MESGLAILLILAIEWVAITGRIVRIIALAYGYDA